MDGEIDWQARAERAEAACAEMRRQIGAIKDAIENNQPIPWTSMCERMGHALSTSCGKDYVPKEQLEKSEKACAEMRNIIQRMYNWADDERSPSIDADAKHALSTDCGSDYVRREELDAAKAEVERLREEIKTLQVDLSCLRGSLSLIAKGKWNVGKPYSVTVTAFAKNALKLVTCSTTPPLATSITNTAP